MSRRKDVLKEPLQSEQEFAIFLKRVRQESGVLSEELAEGLMDISQLSRIESEIRPVPKTMRDRLLGRLGVAMDMYENLMNNEDYAEWKWQHKILTAIEHKDFQKAERLIREYEMQAPLEQIKRQFCIMMQAELLKQRGAARMELANLYEKAVQLTVIKEELYVQPKLLSALEVNMVLEYEYYRGIGSNFSDKCRFWIDYVKDSLYDEQSMAKIFPKIVYYYLREILTGTYATTQSELQRALQFCDDAIKLLRDTGRAFYLVELLEYKKKILTNIIRLLTKSKKQQEITPYQTALKQSAELETLLKELYTEYDVSVYMQDCTYLYRQRSVYAVGDVLRIRRNMFGMTQEEVCDGICSVKSLRRAENKRANMQSEPLGKIMKRLGLSKEIQRANIVTNDRKVLELMTKLAYCRNNREVGKARILLDRLKAKVCLEIPQNKQYVMEAEASLDLMEEKITEEEFVFREEKALQCTLDTKRILETGRLYELEEVYLTELEMDCIQKRIKWLDCTEKRRQIEFLLRFFEKFEQEDKIFNYIVMYEFIMEYIVSELGNMGEYQLAIELNRKVIQSILKCRRIYMVHGFLYDILWNEKEQKVYVGQQIEKEKVADSLRRCMILSHLSKQTFYENFYRNKIYQVT